MCVVNLHPLPERRHCGGRALDSASRTVSASHESETQTSEKSFIKKGNKTNKRRTSAASSALNFNYATCTVCRLSVPTSNSFLVESEGTRPSPSSGIPNSSH